MVKQVLNIPIQVPDDIKVLTSDEYDELTKNSMIGRMWTMKELRMWLGNKSAEWIKDNILRQPKYSKTIREWERTKAIVGGGKGNPYKFKASVITAWLEAHWSELPW